MLSFYNLCLFQKNWVLFKKQKKKQECKQNISAVSRENKK